MSTAMRVISTAPALRFRDLAGLFGRRAASDDEALARPWVAPGDRALWFSRAAWGIGAIVAGHRTGGIAPCLWLPDYFCNQSAWPAREAGA